MIELPVIPTIPGPHNGGPPCDKCGGACCNYLAVRIEEPTTTADFDEILWMVLHRNVAVFRDEGGQWYVWFFTPCEKLTRDGKCGIYAERPQMCRDYGWNEVGEVECEATGGEDSDLLLRTPEDVRTYVLEFFNDQFGTCQDWLERCFSS